MKVPCSQHPLTTYVTTSVSILFLVITHPLPRGGTDLMTQ
jgi:hypothetical protein